MLANTGENHCGLAANPIPQIDWAKDLRMSTSCSVVWDCVVPIHAIGLVSILKANALYWHDQLPPIFGVKVTSLASNLAVFSLHTSIVLYKLHTTQLLRMFSADPVVKKSILCKQWKNQPCKPGVVPNWYPIHKLCHCADWNGIPQAGLSLECIENLMHNTCPQVCTNYMWAVCYRQKLSRMSQCMRCLCGKKACPP